VQPSSTRKRRGRTACGKAGAQDIIGALDRLIERCLRDLVADTHLLNWRAKERDWVNYFAHRYLIAHCCPDGPLKEPAQIGIEVAVPQPKATLIMSTA